jgi:pyruvate,water dikinase
VHRDSRSRCLEDAVVGRDRARTRNPYKGTAYYSTDVEKLLITRSVPKPFRSTSATHLAPSDVEEVLATPLSYAQILKLHLRILSLAGDRGVHNWLHLAESYLRRIEEAEVLSNDELRTLSDRALVTYAEKMVQLEAQYCADIWSGYFIHVPLIFNLLTTIVTKFYDGTNKQVLWDILTGTPVQSATVKENLGLWDLSKRLRADDHLLALFREHKDGEFFARLEDSDAGRDWLADYLTWRAEHHHRGHSDRDIFFPAARKTPAWTTAP